MAPQPSWPLPRRLMPTMRGAPLTSEKPTESPTTVTRTSRFGGVGGGAVGSRGITFFGDAVVGVVWGTMTTRRVSGVPGPASAGTAVEPRPETSRTAATQAAHAPLIDMVLTDQF